MTGPAEVGPTRLVGRPRRPSRKDYYILAGGFCTLIAMGVSLRHPLTASIYLPFLVTRVAFESLRPPTTVAADGIRRPWRRRGFIAWDQISSIAPAQPGYPTPRIVLTGGATVNLHDFTDAREVAEIGGKPVTAPPSPVGTVIAPRPAQPSPAAQAADIERRIQALNTGWAKLAGENHRRPRPPTDTTGTHPAAD